MRSDHTTVLQTMSGLGAERVLIVEGTQPMQLTASCGLSDHVSWTDQVSVSILEHCFRVGGALAVADAQVEFNSRSVSANGIRSVLCVPILSQNLRIDGLIYADVRAKAGVFAPSALERALECARQLQESEPSQEPGQSLPLPKGSTPLGVPLLRPAAATNELVPLRQGLMPILAEIGETLIGYGAERVLVVEKVASMGLLFARGLNPDKPWSEQISLSLIKQVLKDGAPLALADAPSQVDAWSVSMIDIRSVICVAYWSSETRVAGVIYADVRNRRGAFQNSALEAAQNCARKLENFLYRGELLAEWEAPEPPKPVVRAAPTASTRSLGLKSSADTAHPALPTQAVAVSRHPLKSRPRAQSVVMFYRCLATMLGAGLMITRSLDVLTQHSEDPALAAICADLSGQVSSGHPLSRALAAHSQVFRDSERHLIQIGEASGTLHRVLLEIADSQEKFQAMEMRLRSALTYPALVSAFSLAMLLLGPPYLLQGQFDLIRSSGQTPPLLTQMLMTLSDLMRAVGLPVIVASLLGTSWLGARLAGPTAISPPLLGHGPAPQGPVDPAAQIDTSSLCGFSGSDLSSRSALP